MQRTCANAWCGQPFEITGEDRAFFTKVQSPLPTRCPPCREQRRLAFRNERSLYRRPCDACQRTVLTTYHPSSPVSQYCSDCYFGDGWEAMAYGRTIEPELPFFPQWKELFDRVPKLNLYTKFCENCDYANIILHNKNCYLIFGSGYCQDTYYGTHVFYCENCSDCLCTERSTECYELVDCERCYRTHHSRLCTDCTDSAFLFDCHECKNCIGCSNLHRKENHLFNKPVAKEAIDAYRRQEMAATLLSAEEAHALMKRVADGAIHRALVSESSTNVTGNFIYHTKNASSCFNIHECEDVRHLVVCLKQKDSGDAQGTSLGELAYECVNNDYPTFSRWSMNSTYLADAHYCDSCDHCKNCFGCVGIRHKQYCILNKQYSREEYEALLPRIIRTMEQTGEWGEFFPASLSSFAYNETVAQEYYPLSKAEAAKRGWAWLDKKDDVLKVDRTIAAEDLPASIDDIPDDILNWAIVCTATGRPFRIIKQELAFYRTMGLPAPRLHPDERHRRRMQLRNPRKLWQRECANCQKPITTSYSPKRSERVVCEECYLKEVY